MDQAGKSRLETSLVKATKVRKCKGCDAAIRWVVGPGGNAVPVNANWTTVYVWTGERNAEGVPITKRVTGHIGHHATCPVAERFRGTSAR